MGTLIVFIAALMIFIPLSLYGLGFMAGWIQDVIEFWKRSK